MLDSADNASRWEPYLGVARFGVAPGIRSSDVCFGSGSEVLFPNGERRDSVLRWLFRLAVLDVVTDCCGLTGVDIVSDRSRQFS